MSFRTLHHVPAAKQLDATTSLVELARLEAEELEGGSGHRRSLVDEFMARAQALVSAGVSDETHVEVLDILADVEGSLVLAALEGGSHSDENTVAGESRDGESPAEGGSQEPPVPADGEEPIDAPPSEPGPEPAPTEADATEPPEDDDGHEEPSPVEPQPAAVDARPAATKPPRRPTGRLVRVRLPDGSLVAMGMGNVRQRRG